VDEGAGLRTEYVEARRVLLNALETLRPHLDAVVLIGAQAVYLRTIGRLPTYQPFTTDADLVLDPSRLAATPPLGDAMRAAGFVLTTEPGIWEARFRRPNSRIDVVVPVDLIVPEAVAPRAGRRSARLPDEHGKNTARKSVGVEGALVDFDRMEIRSLEPNDQRHIEVSVAGVAALLVAKLHKLGERLDRPERLEAKDAGDVYRLFDAVGPPDLREQLDRLLADERSSTATMTALAYGDRLLGTPAAPGIRLGIDSLRGVLPEATVVAVLTQYWRALREPSVP
jgi:hypothetical protein